MAPRSVGLLSSTEPISVLFNGEPPRTDELRHPALVNYGHYTAMQVRDGKVRGLQLHLGRSADAHRELFASDLDPQVVCASIRVAIADTPDCYLRVVFFEVAPGELSVMTVRRPPVSPSTDPISLMPVEYQRAVAHVKHVGTFSKVYFAIMAQRAGFDDAIHTTPDGWISETTGANIGFLDGERIVWPAHPTLRGVTWSLLDAALRSEGVDSVCEPVNVRDVSRYSVAFLSNSIGIAPVASIGDHAFGDSQALVQMLTKHYESTPWDEI